MKDGFLKAAALSPALRVADCAYNTRQILTELRAAAARGVKLAVFPEFCLTGYTCGDLFLQRPLQQGALTGLQELLDASRVLDTVALVGLPLMVRGKLYNCAAVLCRGQLLGLVPKTYLPNYGEFYEKRQLEFDVLRAVGAVKKDLKRLFLIDALLNSLLSGAVYTGVSFLAVRLLCKFLNSPYAFLFSDVSRASIFSPEMPLVPFFIGLVLTLLFAAFAVFLPAYLYFKKTSDHVAADFAQTDDL